MFWAQMPGTKRKEEERLPECEYTPQGSTAEFNDKLPILSQKRLRSNAELCRLQTLILLSKSFFHTLLIGNQWL